MNSRAEKDQGALKQVAEKIRARRKELGLTLEKVAKDIGVSAQQMQKYEAALSKIDCIKMIEISKSLKAPTCYFLDEKLAGQSWYKLLAHFGRIKQDKIRELVIIVAEKASEIEDSIKL